MQTITSPFRFRFKSFLLSPFKTMLINYVGVIVVAGLLVRTFERSVLGTELSTVYDGFWQVAETQGTIGYGDIFITSHLSRLVCSAAAFMGSFTNSLVVSSLLNTAKLNIPELQFASAVRKSAQVCNRTVSATLIQRWWRLVLARKHSRPNRFFLLWKLHEQAVRFHRNVTKLNSSKERPELEKLLHSTRVDLDKEFQDTIKKLQELKKCQDDLDTISGRMVDFMANTLILKRRVAHHILLYTRRHEPVPRQRTSTRKSTSNSSKQQQKIASEIAFRRMLEWRKTVRSATDAVEHQLFVRTGLYRDSI